MRLRVIRNEKEFTRMVMTAAEQLGWVCYHTRYSIGSKPGFPDLVLVRPPRVIFAELKMNKRRLTESQRYWIELLQQCECEAYVWRLSDWENGMIASVLTMGTGGIQ